MAVVQVTGLGRKYGSRWLFRGLEFAAVAGDVLAVTGPNGCGKSTLLKIVAGLVSASEGEIARPANIGCAALDLSLYGELTGEEHLRFSADLRGCAPRLDLLDQYGLTDARTKPAKLYSSGMRARLKLCLATQHRPDLLILDEPTAALDDAGRELVRRAVAEQKPRGPVLIATNDQRDLEWATHELRLG